MRVEDFHPYAGAVDVSEDGHRAIRLTNAGLELWDLEAGRRVRVLAGAWRGWMSSSGRVLVTSTRYGETLHVSTWEGAPLCVIPGDGSAVAVSDSCVVTRRSAQVTVESQLGVTLAYRGLLEAHDLHGRQLWRREAPLVVFTSNEAAMSRDGRRALVVFAEDKLHLVDSATGKTIWSGGSGVDAQFSSLIPWGRSGVAWTADDSLRVADDAGVRSLTIPKSGSLAWVSPDATRLVLRSRNNVEVRNAKDGAVIARVTAPEPFSRCFIDGADLVLITMAMKTRRVPLGR